MARNPLGFTSEKQCIACPNMFSRPDGWSNRKWLHQKRCDVCVRVELKVRLLAGSKIGPGGCFLWEKRRDRNTGYGRLSVHDRDVQTHVLAFELFHGPVPQGKEVCHKCDVRGCWNPDHLFAGTHKENVADCIAKGRNSNPPIISGTSCHNATLTFDQVTTIRELRARGVTQRQVAVRFGVSQSTVWRLAHQRTRRSA